MLTYYSGRKCPKCGANKTQDTHYAEGAFYPWPGSPSIHQPESIRRRCYRCGYCWDEAPLDAKVGEGAQDAT